MTTTLEKTTPPAPPARPRRGGPGTRALVWTGGVLGAAGVLLGAWSQLGVWFGTGDRADLTRGTATYDARDVVELYASGPVQVHAGGDAVVVDRESRSAFSSARYSASSDDERLTVHHQCAWWSSTCTASLDVTVPQGTSVVVHAGDGDVTVADLTGTLEIHTADGDTAVARVTGDVTVRSADGRTTVHDVHGSVDTKASDGGTEVREVTGDVRARAADGNIVVAAVEGDVDAQASDGDVTVHGTGEPVALDIATADGHQTVEGPTDPTADRHVRIHTRDGNASYLGPRD